MTTMTKNPPTVNRQVFQVLPSVEQGQNGTQTVSKMAFPAVLFEGILACESQPRGYVKHSLRKNPLGFFSPNIIK